MSAQPSRLARFFFLRPTFALLLLLSLVGGGLLAVTSMVKEKNPDLAIPQATIVVEWPGADPETVESQLANEMEKSLKSVEGLKTLRSASFDSFCILAVEFVASADVSESMARLRAKVDEAAADLPDEAKQPRVNEVSMNNQPILSLSLVGDIAEQRRSDLLEVLEERLQKLRGVNEVNISGNRDEVVRVDLLAPRLAALGLQPTAIRQALQAASIDQPWDRYESRDGAVVLVLRGRMRTLAQIRELPVARVGNGRIVRLQEVAEVDFGLEREKSRAFVSRDGAPFAEAVDVSITRLPGADVIELVRQIEHELADLRHSNRWPEGLEFFITSDASEEIEESLGDGLSNTMQASIAVFIVLLVALTWREALIAGLAIPVTFLGSMAVISAMGYSLSNLIIIGMILALGLLVDVFILMMEGMHDALYVQNKSFNEAALDTVKTYAGPAFAGQLTTILALAPLMAIGGTDGKFIRYIPITAVTCLAVAFVVALIVCIPLSQFLLRSTNAKPGTVDRVMAQASERLSGWISRTIVAGKGRAAGVIAACVGVLAVAVMSAGNLPSELYPKADGRNLGITITLPADATLDQAQSCADTVGEALRGEPYFESVTKFVGRQSPYARASLASALSPDEDAYFVGFSTKFTPEEERSMLSFEYLEPLRDKLAEPLRACPGASMYLSPQATGASADAPIELRIIGEDLDELREVSARIQAQLRKTPGATDVRDDLGDPRPTFEFDPNLEALDFHGLSVNDLAGQVRLGFAEDTVIKMPRGGTEDELEVRLGTSWPSRAGKPGGPTSPWEVMTLSVTTREGRSVPLWELANGDLVDAPLTITRYEGERAVTVKADTHGVTASEVLAELEDTLEAIRDEHPEIEISLGGEAEGTAETFGSAINMLWVALFLVFAVLTIQFDSFSQPVAMLSVVPLSLAGTIGFFQIFGLAISFPALIGIISLVGIVVNNAIVMISAMNTLRAEGKSVREAAAEGAASRLRPILSTTLTTLAGMVPLALSDPMWFPLAGAIIGGLAAGTVFAMVATPAVYRIATSDTRNE